MHRFEWSRFAQRNAVVWTAWGLSACCTEQVLHVRHVNLDGNSEYWVCEGGSAKGCRGERPVDIDPAGFQHRSQVVAPPPECPLGVANLDIVLDGTEVKRVRYECAHAQEPTGLPPPAAETSDGLPPAVPASSSEGSGLPPPAPSVLNANGFTGGLPPPAPASTNPVTP